MGHVFQGFVLLLLLFPLVSTGEGSSTLQTTSAPRDEGQSFDDDALETPVWGSNTPGCYWRRVDSSGTLSAS